ncbi:methylmalonyl-CoA mutase family protein [Roseibium algae]|uniref:Methylmalonyl-CoA mutase family protein n=1 Tax=Roseibium algae TaxID=3123038 RepID=A0ABU8TJH5_9HYPH
MSLNVPQIFLGETEQSWLAAAEKALKGAPLSRLNGQTEDGFEFSPLFARRIDAMPRSAREAQKPWTVFQRIDIPDPVEANRQIHDDLEGGADGLELVFPTALLTADGYGLQVECISDLEKVLDGVFLDLVKIRIGAGYGAPAYLAMLMAYLEKRSIDPSLVQVNLGADPIGRLARRGKSNLPIEEQWRRNLDGIFAIERAGANTCFYSADGRIWHDGGASQAEELACTMASLLAYLRVMDGHSVPAESWQKHVSLTLVAEADQIGTIAKARAARRIWASILDACGLEQKPLQLHMQTSYRMLSKVDPWVNLLRNTVATFAAGVGGADSVSVLPFTRTLGLPDAFARRLARNTQSILLEESQLHMVADPAAGSGAIEAHTDALVASTWALLQEIDAGGGMIRSLQEGWIQGRLSKTQSRRNDEVAHRKRPITGASEFPDLAEKPVAVLEVTPAPVEEMLDPIALCEPGAGERFEMACHAFSRGVEMARALPLAMSSRSAMNVAPLHSSRISEPFEVLRELADTQAGGAPNVFLACLGPLSHFTARATWVANAFAAGGVNCLGGVVYDSFEDMLEAFKVSGSSIACLVSSDKVYADQAEAAARSLKAAGAEYLYLAGKPGDEQVAYKAAGVDTFIFAGCNLLGLLQAAHARFGIADDLEDLS